MMMMSHGVVSLVSYANRRSLCVRAAYYLRRKECKLTVGVLQQQSINYPSGTPLHLPQSYGSFHQLHRIDGQLIAMSVIDIVPKCVSSVYFMYEKKWEKFSLGKESYHLIPRQRPIADIVHLQLSAMREASLVKEMHEAGLTDMQFLYMGQPN